MQAIILRLPDHTYVTIRMIVFTNEYVAVKFLFFFVFVYGNACGGGGGASYTVGSLTFSSDLVRGVHAV